MRNRLTHTRSRALNALGNAGSTRAELWNVDSSFLCIISKQTERKTRIKCMHVCCWHVNFLYVKKSICYTWNSSTSLKFCSKVCKYTISFMIDGSSACTGAFSAASSRSNSVFSGSWFMSWTNSSIFFTAHHDAHAPSKIAGIWLSSWCKQHTFLCALCDHDRHWNAAIQRSTDLSGLKLFFLNPTLFLLTLFAAKLVASATRFSSLSNNFQAELMHSSVTSLTWIRGSKCAL